MSFASSIRFRGADFAKLCGRSSNLLDHGIDYEFRFANQFTGVEIISKIGGRLTLNTGYFNTNLLNPESNHLLGFMLLFQVIGITLLGNNFDEYVEFRADSEALTPLLVFMMHSFCNPGVTDIEKALQKWQSLDEEEKSPYHYITSKRLADLEDKFIKAIKLLSVASIEAKPYSLPLKGFVK